MTFSANQPVAMPPLELELGNAPPFRPRRTNHLASQYYSTYCLLIMFTNIQFQRHAEKPQPHVLENYSLQRPYYPTEFAANNIDFSFFQFLLVLANAVELVQIWRLAWETPHANGLSEDRRDGN